MKISKTKISCQLKDLYGKNGYQKTIKVGNRYWYYWANNSVIGEKYGQDWYEIEVTYIRSGCMFYIFTKYPDIPEQYCPISCFFTSILVVSELDPIRDIPEFSNDIKYSKLLYCFDDEHTVIKNWDNSPESNISEEDIATYPMLSVFAFMSEKF